MNPSLSLLSPAWLQLAAVFVCGSSVALAGLHATMLGLAGSRTSLSPATRARVPLFAALLLGGWLGWAIVIAQQRVLAGPVFEPLSAASAVPRLLAMLLPIGIGAAFLASHAVRTLNAAMPPAWLIAVQVYRTAGVMFLWPFPGYGQLPAGFALPAGIGDAITGLAAPFVALMVARRRPGAYRWAVAWNWFGIVDLIVAPITAILTRAPVTNLYPIALIPIFLGPPLGILTHIYSLRNLAANRMLFERTPTA